MKWLVVAGILIFVLYKLRSTLIQHRIFGPAFRVLLGPNSPAEPLTSRDWLKGVFYLSAFAAVGFLCHYGLSKASQETSWTILDSPYLESFAATTLWVAGLALIAAVFSLVAALVQAVRAMAVKTKQKEE